MKALTMWGLRFGTTYQPLAGIAPWRATSPAVRPAGISGRVASTSRRASSLQCPVYATAVGDEPKLGKAGAGNGEVKVRFAPSPTGNLHVGGARTALFNWLLAKNLGGKMVLRVEDTDKSRSTKESEEAVMEDLKWLGITWNEGPDVGGDNGPYRQSERTDLYKKYVDDLVERKLAYPCFCTDEELKQMKEEAEAKKLPPIYRGPWASASQEEVDEMLAKGTPHCYRFRVPKDKLITVNDAIRGEVTWNTDTLGDFVILRSNGLPVYNFCVAVDDALMGITHVMRAEEHLPNTLRQLLIYRALGFSEPVFGHMSLILAPDKSKLSKRHGATSVGEFREEGFLAEAMLNYLSLLGWNDGTEQEIYTVEELQEKFSVDRVTKSGAVFDKAKLAWMNGQHLRALPEETAVGFISKALVKAGVVTTTEGPFVQGAIALVKESIDLVTEAAPKVEAILGYPLTETLASEDAAPFIEDNLKEVAEAVVAAYDSGDLQEALKDDAAGFGKWLKGVGKGMKRKGKRLFMPARIILTGRMQGPDIGKVLALVESESGELAEGVTIVKLDARIQAVRDWLASQ